MLLACVACAANAAGSIRGSVEDVLGRALGGVVVELRDAKGARAGLTHSDREGHFHFEPITAGRYSITARKKGFAASTVMIEARAGASPPLAITLAAARVTLPLHANRIAPNQPAATGASVYRFNRAAIEHLPRGDNTSLRDLLIQSPGVSQDAYGQGQGQIHIHGDNGGGIQTRIDGVFVPDPVNSFGESLTPRYAKSVDLITGLMPAEYGLRNEGVIDLRTKEGCPAYGGVAEFFGGQRQTIQPSLEYGGCRGKLGYFISGSYFGSNLGLQAPTPGPSPTHDHTDQGHFAANLTYLIGQSARLSIFTADSISHFEIPPNVYATPQFQLTGVPIYPARRIADTEMEQSYLGIARLDGHAGEHFSYHVAYFSRYYRLNFDPDPIGDLIYNGIAARLMHSGFVNGLQADATYRLGSHRLGAGIYLSGETIELDDHAQAFPANPDGSQKSKSPTPIVDNNHGRALLYGIYLQDEWRLGKKLILNYGARWDLMDAFVEQWQFSPRLDAVYHLTPQLQLHAGYARFFQAPPFESIALSSIDKFAGTTGASAITTGNDQVKAEDDHYFGAGIAQTLPRGLAVSLDGFFFLAHDKLDLAQFANTQVFAPLNYRRARSWGSDLSLVRRGSRFSGYFNFSYSVLQATDISAGQFLADDPAELAYIARHWITLDDSQAFTASAGASYRWRGMILSVDSIWGSGYRRGFANSGTLPPILQVDAAVARQFDAPGIGAITGRLAVINLFDHPYQIRNGTGIGVFSPQWGPRRALYGGAKIAFPSL